MFSDGFCIRANFTWNVNQIFYLINFVSGYYLIISNAVRQIMEQTDFVRGISLNDFWRPLPTLFFYIPIILERC